MTWILLFCKRIFFCRDLIKALKDRRTDIYLVSGGFRSIIRPIADYLNIPNKNVFANQMKFDASGNKNKKNSFIKMNFILYEVSEAF